MVFFTLSNMESWILLWQHLSLWRVPYMTHSGYFLLFWMVEISSLIFANFSFASWSLWACNNDHIQYDTYDWLSDKKVNHCLQSTKEVAIAQLCCAVHLNSDPSSTLNMFSSDAKNPSFRAMVDHTDTEIAITLLFIIPVMTWLGMLAQNDKQISISTSTTCSFCSQLWLICDYQNRQWRRHSQTTPFILWSLPSLHCLTAIVNESVHLTEAQDIVHCTHFAFKELVTGFHLVWYSTLQYFQ